MEAFSLAMFTVGMYMLPGIIACIRNKKNKLAICTLNAMLGWSIIGWIAALVWAVMKD